VLDCAINFFRFHARVFLIYPFLLASSTYLEIDLREVKPATLQSEAMRSDSPHGEPIFERESKVLWVAGESNLWRWSLDTNAVTRIELPAGLKHPFNLLDIKPKNIWGFDRQAIWIFDISSKIWRKISYQLDADCLLNSASVSQSSGEVAYFISSTCGGYWISQATETVVGWRSKDKSTKDFFALVNGSDSSGPYFLLPNRKQILKLRLKEQKVTSEIVYHSKSELLGIKGEGDNFVAWTSKAIIIFDRAMNRRQVIPVVGRRNIAAFAASADLHGLIFDDGAAEIMDLKSNQKWFGKEPIKRVQNIDFIDDAAYLVISSKAEIPRVFRVTIRR